MSDMGVQVEDSTLISPWSVLSESEKLKKENINPGEAGLVMVYRGQSFVRVGDKSQCVSRDTPGPIQGKGVQNPQLKVGDGPIRGSTVPWDLGESVQNQGSPRYHLSLSRNSRNPRLVHRNSWTNFPRHRNSSRTQRIIGSPAVLSSGVGIHHQSRNLSVHLRYRSSIRKTSTPVFRLRMALFSLTPPECRGSCRTTRKRGRDDIKSTFLTVSFSPSSRLRNRSLVA